MTVKQVQVEIQARSERFAAMSDGELLSVIEGAMDAFIDSVLDFCVAVTEAIKRRIDLGDIKRLVPKYCARIASGNVSPSAWLRFSEHPLLMDRIATLPFEKQESLANGERVPMVKRRIDGSYDPRNHVNVDPLDLKPEEVRYVFAEGSIRDVREQARRAESLAAMEPKESKCKLVLTLEEELDERLGRLAADAGMTKKEFSLRQLRKAR